ncbi:tyrosine-type recombinase/integrase [Aliarcobacter thereius]|uniref:tyrosine-type recombinase/integrase n=1 Tax=Aliarcobacter thereius TaxID=544718 RepID=UPI0008241D31|nr:tyrosine-type recombinase/integrase [Aliarcobacter thereius]OCL90567.1 Transposase from transposon Tn916 [Aliarcobacter thereius]
MRKIERKIGWDIPKRKNKLTGKLEGNIIYVLGTVDGVFYRKSTGKEATAINIAWIKKNARDVLLKIIDKQNTEKESKNSLEDYGYRVIESTSRLRSLNTQKEKEGYFRNHILPYFKSRGIDRIEDIKTTEVEIWQNQLLKKYSTSTVKKCKDTLGLIMNKAVADDIIVKNYVSLSDNIKMKSKKRTPYTVSEVVLLLKESKGWFKTFLYLVFSTGLRTGEAIGLMWKDIDFENGFIDLNRSITKSRVTTKKGNCTIQEYIKNDYEIVFENNTNTTKNHNRIIPLDNKTKEILMEEYLKRTQDEWIFVNKDNICFADSSSINRYYWKPLLAKTKVEDKDLYTARHTYISIMKNSGADESFLKAIGGWTQSSNVLNNHYFTHENSKEDIKKANNFFYNLKDMKAKAD